MADAISLGASVLAFVTVAAQLTRITYTFFDSIKDAPEDIRRLPERLKDLQFILQQIYQLGTINPQYEADPDIRGYWDIKAAKLQRDFDEFQTFAEGLKAKDIRGRVKWFLSDHDRAKKILSLLCEDIEVLRCLHQIMESCVFFLD